MVWSISEDNSIIIEIIHDLLFEGVLEYGWQIGVEKRLTRCERSAIQDLPRDKLIRCLTYVLQGFTSEGIFKLVYNNLIPKNLAFLGAAWYVIERRAQVRHEEEQAKEFLDDCDKPLQLTIDELNLQRLFQEEKNKKYEMESEAVRSKINACLTRKHSINDADEDVEMQNANQVSVNCENTAPIESINNLPIDEVTQVPKRLRTSQYCSPEVAEKEEEETAVEIGPVVCLPKSQSSTSIAALSPVTMENNQTIGSRKRPATEAAEGDSVVPAQTSENLEDASIVVFDIETTGFMHFAEICQIAAIHNDKRFNVYIAPEFAFTREAAATTGLQVVDGQMLKEDKILDTVPTLHQALQQFIEFLRTIGPSIILVAHNGFKFDVRMILREIKESNLLNDFKSVVKGFADTLIIFRNHLEDRIQAKKKFSLVALTEDFLGINAEDGAHDAKKDVENLNNLIQVIGIDADMFRNEARSVTSELNALELADTISSNKMYLRVLAPRVSAGMIKKLATAEITIELLKKAYTNGQEEGIKMLLGEDVGGRPRVTKNARVLKELTEQINLLIKKDNEEAINN